MGSIGRPKEEERPYTASAKLTPSENALLEAIMKTTGESKMDCIRNAIRRYAEYIMDQQNNY